MTFIHAIEKFNINNTKAIAFLRSVRMEYSGMSKVYGTRYLAQLAKVCGYSVADSGKALVLGPANATKKVFNSNKEAGEFMESKINDLYELGIMK